MNMMNLEGTAHEKALLVLFAYIIGFVSAFITFNYAVPPTNSFEIPIAKVSTETSVANVASVPSVASEPEDSVRAVYENNGLYLYGLQSEPVLLSKNISSVDLTYDQLPTQADRQGFHSEVPTFEYFAEHGYLFFCEVYDNSDTCTPFMYDVERGVLRVVSSEATPVEVSIEEARAVSMNGALGLRVGEYSSETLSQPWKVVGI